MNIVIQPRTLSGRVVIPPSKSISHRALICAALAKGESEITGVLQCEDIDATTEALTALGAEIRTENGVTYVKGIEKAPEYAEKGEPCRKIFAFSLSYAVQSVFCLEGGMWAGCPLPPRLAWKQCLPAAESSLHGR